MADQNWMDALNSDPDLLPDGDEIDELIRSTKEELARTESPSEPEEESPAPETPKETPKIEAFEPKIPDIYADLTLDEEEEEEPEVRPKKRLATGWRVLIYVVCVITTSVALAIFGWKCADDVLALTKPDHLVTITITEGDGIEQVTKKLKAGGMIEYEWLFRFYAWFSHAEEKIDAGTYELNNLYDYHALVNGMRGTSNRIVKSVTIPEGYDCALIFELLEKKGVCRAEDLYEVAANTEFDYDFLSGLPYGERNRLEGYLFPDTYEFYAVTEDELTGPMDADSVGDDAERVVDKFLKNFQRKLDEDTLTAIDDLNLMMRENMQTAGFSEASIEAAKMDLGKVVIVASLIEKETASSKESATISSVIYNRLCSTDYPLLEIDATVLYALGEHKETLTTADLMVDSLYNTRKYPGLPIGPIANPGMDSIHAALHPETTHYYFYALDKDGKHHFSETYQEHKQFLDQLETE